MINYDIAVVGGGSAGICAALAAARCGASVILLEKSDRLGGMGTLAKVHTFCGLYHPDISKPPTIVNPGLPAEIEKMMRETTGVEPVRMGKVYVLPQSPEAFAHIAKKLCEAEKNLSMQFKTTCESAKQIAGEFELTTSSGALRTKALIDTSSDALLATMLGATRVSAPADKQQRSATIFSLTGVTAEATEESAKMKLSMAIMRAAQSGEIPSATMATGCRESTTPGEIFFTTDLPPAPHEALLSQGREIAEKLTTYLRREVAGFKNAVGPFMAISPGIRETFQWEGKYQLTGDDLISGKKFPDSVAYASWPLELRENSRLPKFIFFEQKQPSEIPLSCLTSAEIEGVFFAGRCIAADHQAQASIRVMGTCFATGQAAGQAAVSWLASDEKLPHHS